MPKRSPVHNKKAGTKDRAKHDKWYYYNNRNDPVRKFRDSVRWKNCRKMFRAHHPLCFDPFHDHAKAEQDIQSTEVHHIVGLRVNIRLGLVWANLAALCHACHSKVEQIEGSGNSTGYLFRGRDG